MQIRLLALAVPFLVAGSASAHTPPPDDLIETPPVETLSVAQPTVERPTLELTTWLGVGGGGRAAGQEARGVFDLRFGYDVTLPVAREGDVRIGPFAEVASATFSSISAVGGLEVFLGSVPRPLRMFFYSGEGTFLVRLGGGWSWWTDVPRKTSAPVTSLTLAYGYRCPFSLHEPAEEPAQEPGQRRSSRYMIGVRLWVNGTVGFASSRIWQVSGGIEFEPIGSFRYLLGLY